MWIHREIRSTLEQTVASRSVVVLSGVRQAGKTCLLQQAFPQYHYVSLDLPLSLHSRSAGKYLVDILVTAGVGKVCLHAFDGKVGYALAGAGRGYVFSIPPTVVHSNQKRKLALRLPVESILFETDSPALGPVRGERNEPANLMLVVEQMSGLKGLSKNELIVSSFEALKGFLGKKASERWLSA